MDALQAQGNDFFRKKEYENAITSYTEALESNINASDLQRATLWSNRAAASLKLLNYDDCIQDCTSSVASYPIEKAYFRRASAYIALGKHSLAFNDLKKVVSLNPDNRQAIKMAQECVQLGTQQASILTAESVETALVALSEIAEKEDEIRLVKMKETVALVMTSSSTIGEFVQEEGLIALWNLVEKGVELKNTSYLEGVCVLAALANVGGQAYIRHIMAYSAAEILLLKCSTMNELSPLAASAIATLLTHLMQDCLQKDGKDIEWENEPEAKAVFQKNVHFVLQIIYDPIAQELLVTDTLTGFITMATSKEIVLTFLQLGLLPATLPIAGREEPSMLARLALLYSHFFSKLDDDDAVKKSVQTLVLDTLKMAPVGIDIDWIPYIQATGVLRAIFLVNRDVGLWAVSQANVITTLCALLEGPLCAQSRSMDLLAMTVGIKEGVSVVDTPLAVRCLQRLLPTSNASLGASALSVYIKLITMKESFDETSEMGARLVHFTLQRLGECPLQKEEERKRCKDHCIEALSYMIHLTSVKESVVRHHEALTTLVTMHSSEKNTVAYGMAYILSHLMTSEGALKKKKMAGMQVTPEQYEQLQAAMKQQSAFEDGDHKQKVAFRVKKVVDAGGIRTLVVLSKLQSPRIMESVSQSLLHASEQKNVHGMMIQQGALQALIPYTHVLSSHLEDVENKDKYVATQIFASQALAKIMISTNPASVQSSHILSAIQPLMALCQSESQLHQFEALMALTTIASRDDDSKARILAQGGLKTLQYLQFSDHLQIRRAATEAMSNLLPFNEVVEMIRKPDRLRLWIAFARQEDDFELSRAAAGALAMLSESPEIAPELIEAEILTVVTTLLSSTNSELHHRGLYLVQNLVEVPSGRTAVRASNLRPLVQALTTPESTLCTLATEIVQNIWTT